MTIKLNLIFALAFLNLALTGCSKSTKDNAEHQSNQVKEKNNTGDKSKMNINIHDITVRTMDGNDKSLSAYKDKVLLIVNVASKCGNTPQYKGLESMYEKYKDKGFEILAFPCNDFGEQEPGTNDEIRTFCESKYNVTFELFDKVKVLGESKDALYSRLINNSDPEEDIGWNFEKFLIDKNGNIVSRYKSKVQPDSEALTLAIETELAK